MNHPYSLIIIADGRDASCIVAGLVSHIYNYPMIVDSINSNCDIISIFLYGQMYILAGGISFPVNGNRLTCIDAAVYGKVMVQQMPCAGHIGSAKALFAKNLPGGGKGGGGQPSIVCEKQLVYPGLVILGAVVETGVVYYIHFPVFISESGTVARGHICLGIAGQHIISH